MSKDWYPPFSLLRIPLICGGGVSRLALRLFEYYEKKYHAECWGESAVALLKLCPNAKLLVLAVTNIRYLDNNRDVTEELLCGHIAREMTLGEAAVRGVLPTLNYETTVYRYQKSPADYVSPDGYTIGELVKRQRHVRFNLEKSGAVLTEGCIAKLDESGMRWEKEDSRPHRLELAQGSKRENRDLKVLTSHKTGEDIGLCG